MSFNASLPAFLFFSLNRLWGLVFCLIQQIAAEAARCSEKQARLLDLRLQKMALFSIRNTLGNSDFVEVFHLNTDSV